jgi:hypothetical protein
MLDFAQNLLIQPTLEEIEGAITLVTSLRPKRHKLITVSG